MQHGQGEDCEGEDHDDGGDDGLWQGPGTV